MLLCKPCDLVQVFPAENASCWILGGVNDEHSGFRGYPFFQFTNLKAKSLFLCQWQLDWHSAIGNNLGFVNRKSGIWINNFITLAIICC